MAKADLNYPANNNETYIELNKLSYGDLSKEDIKKYSFLIDIDVDNLKETLQDLTLNYYKYYINGDALNFNETAEKINRFIDLDIPAINDFINYSFILASYSILNSLYDFDLDLFAPANPGLNIKGYKEREAENSINRLRLNQDEVNAIIEYNKKKIDLYALKDLESEEKKENKTKYINIDAPAFDNAFILLNSNYTGDFDVMQEMKVYIMLDLQFFEHYEITKEMAKAVNKPIFNIVNKEVLLNDGNISKLKKVD